MVLLTLSYFKHVAGNKKRKKENKSVDACSLLLIISVPLLRPLLCTVLQICGLYSLSRGNLPGES